MAPLRSWIPSNGASLGVAATRNCIGIIDATAPRQIVAEINEDGTAPGGVPNRAASTVARNEVGIGWLWKIGKMTPAIIATFVGQTGHLCMVGLLLDLAAIPRDPIEIAPSRRREPPGQIVPHITLPLPMPTLSMVTIPSVPTGFAVSDLLWVIGSSGPGLRGLALAGFIYFQAFGKGSRSFGSPVAVAIGPVMLGVTWIQTAMQSRDARMTRSWGNPDKPDSDAIARAVAARHLGSRWKLLAAIFVLPLWIVPFQFLSISILVPTGEFAEDPPLTFPAGLTPVVDNAAQARSPGNRGQAMPNSAFCGGVWTEPAVFFEAMASFAIARLDIPGQPAWFMPIFARTVFPLQMYLISLFLGFHSVGLLGFHCRDGVVLHRDLHAVSHAGAAQLHVRPVAQDGRGASDGRRRRLDRTRPYRPARSDGSDDGRHPASVHVDRERHAGLDRAGRPPRDALDRECPAGIPGQLCSTGTECRADGRAEREPSRPPSDLRAAASFQECPSDPADLIVRRITQVDRSRRHLGPHAACGQAGIRPAPPKILTLELEPYLLPGVSRKPARGSLARLAERNVVFVLPQRGSRIAPPRMADPEWVHIMRPAVRDRHAATEDAAGRRRRSDPRPAKRGDVAAHPCGIRRPGELPRLARTVSRSDRRRGGAARRVARDPAGEGPHGPVSPPDDRAGR